MVVSTVDLYEKIKTKIGDEGARILIEYVDSKIEKEAVTKLDLKDTEDEVKSEINRVEVELRNEINRVENELKSEINRVEVELRNEISRVENELKSEINRVEVELRSEINAVKSELRNEINKIDLKVKDLEWKMKLYFIIIGILIVVSNPKVLDLFGKLLIIK